MNYLAIFIGGGIGSLLRYFTSTALKKYHFFNFPVGTFVSNILASLLLGLFVGYFLTKNIENSIIKNLLLVGVCGGFSTFSTFGYENYSFISNGFFTTSIAYILLSIIASFVVIYIGVFISNMAFSS